MSGNLLANVSIDTEMNASFSSGSIDLGELEPTPRVNTERSEFDQVQNDEESPLNIGRLQKQKTPFPGKNEISLQESSNEEADLSRVDVGSENFDNEKSDNVIESDVKSQREGNLEPLLPARLKPAKEKANNHSKEEERDEKPKRKTPSPPKLKSRTELEADLDKSERSKSDISFVEPLTQLQGTLSIEQQQELAQKRFEAFFIRGSANESEELLTHRSDVTVAESYVIDKSKTPEAARAAGIPIIEDTGLSPRRLSREGSVASSKSSGDFSDHESHKIHIDHKTRETVYDNNYVNKVNLNNFQNLSSPGDFIMQKPVIVGRTPKTTDKQPKGLSTNFAQIRQMKQHGNIDNSGFVYMQHGKDVENQAGSLRDAFQRNKSEKKTTFAPLPNQTTWGQSSSAASANRDEADGATANGTGTANQELLKIRMKLEEKRKAIERKKHSQEIQQQKIRQRLGKAAFLHVVSKAKDDDSVPTSSGTAEPNTPARMTSSDPEVPVLSPRREVEPRAQNSVEQDKAAYNKPNRPFNRDDIQQTIENVRKKWFNNEDLVAPKDMTPSDYDSPEMSRSQSSSNSDRPSTLDNLEQIDTMPVNDGVGRRPLVFDRRSTSVERITSLGDHADIQNQAHVRESSPHSSVHSRRSASVERHDIPSHPTLPDREEKHKATFYDKTAAQTESENVRPEPSVSPRVQGQFSTSQKKPETYEEYNSSLDKLNQSLNDLQGEIMKLSLKQRKPDHVTRSRSGSRSPPHHLEVGSKTLPTRLKESAPETVELARSRSAHQTNSAHRSASEPRQIQPEVDGEPITGQYQSSTLPRQPNMFHQNQVPHPQYMVQNQVPVAGPTGPVYGNPNQFIPMTGQTGIPPSAQQYGSYIMGPTAQQPLAQIPQAQVSSPFQHSPPHMYPPAATMYPGQPFPTQPIVSPQTQPFPGIYPSPPQTQFQPQIPVHPVGTYTTSVHSHQIPFTPTTQPFDPTNQYIYQQQPQQQPFSTYSDTKSSVPQTETEQRRSVYTSSKSDRQSDFNDKTIESTQTHDISQTESEPKITSKIESETALDKHQTSEKGGGFFVSVDEGSPRRVKSKPLLTEKKQKSEPVKDIIEDTSRFESPVLSDFAQKVEPKNAMGKEPVIVRHEPTTEDGEDRHEAAVGFVIGQDETSLDEVMYDVICWCCPCQGFKFGKRVLHGSIAK